MHEIIWVDGIETKTCLAGDRGLAYGDGLFETIRVLKGRLTLASFHCTRLEEGCKRLSVNVDLSAVMHQLTQFIHLHNKQDGVVKIIITRGSGGRGYNPHGTKNRCILQWFPLPVYDEKNNNGRGVKLYPCKLRLGWQPALAGIKHLNRLEQVLARQEWQEKDYAEGLLMDFQDNIIECTMSNIFFVYNDTLITPDLSRCGVSGVMRQWILNQSALPVKTKVCHLSVDHLKNATELFICNSVFGIWPVISYRDYQWPVGNITRHLQQKAEFMFHDETMG